MGSEGICLRAAVADPQAPTWKVKEKEMLLLAMEGAVCHAAALKLTGGSGSFLGTRARVKTLEPTNPTLFYIIRKGKLFFPQDRCLFFSLYYSNLVLFSQKRFYVSHFGSSPDSFVSLASYIISSLLSCDIICLFFRALWQNYLKGLDVGYVPFLLRFMPAAGGPGARLGGQRHRRDCSFHAHHHSLFLSPQTTLCVL